MKRIFLLILHIVMPSFAEVELSIKPIKYTPIPLRIGYLEGKNNQELADVVTHMQKNFMFTGQFYVDAQLYDKVPHKKELTVLHEQGTLFMLMLKEIPHGYEWHLYDTMNAALVSGKKYAKKGDVVRGWAHNMADDVWSALTGQEGFFSTKIAYCKMKLSKKGKEIKHIYVADYDGSNEQLLVGTQTINVAPRWNNDRKRPLLFYSDFTNTNVRLMVSDMSKKRAVASDFDGVNMIPAFSKDGKKLVYCLSRGDGSCQLYYCEKGIFKRLTNNAGNNVSPSFCDETQTVYFCSDFQTGSPQLYAFHIDTNELERITVGGYCASPRYSPTSKKLAYAKLIDGIMQLFVYDTVKKTHIQVTSSKGNKEEFAWSPCGNRLLYSIEEPGRSSRIAMMNMISFDWQYLTEAHDVCSYPDWSPHYEQFPVVA